MTQPTNGIAAVNADGTITYTPNAGFTGTDIFSYTVSDGVDTVSATVVVTVGPTATPALAPTPTPPAGATPIPAGAAPSPPSSPPPELAFTGTDVAPLFVAALMLLLAGRTLVVAADRRSRGRRR